MPIHSNFYNNCGCIVNYADGINSITQQFISDMATTGVYYTPQQQIALDNLIVSLLGSDEIVYVTSLPAIGETGILYVLNNKQIYFWDGFVFQYAISQNDFTNAYKTKVDGAILSINSLLPDGSGNIVITKSDIGLGNVDNTSDVNKPISNDAQTELNLKEDLVNKVTSLTVVNNTTYGTSLAVKSYIDSIVTGLWDDRGNYNASVNTFPSTGGSGTSD